MLLDYTRIDPELLPALETFPALDLNRENIVKMRDLLASGPQGTSSIEVLSDKKASIPKTARLIFIFIEKMSSPTNLPFFGSTGAVISWVTLKTKEQESSRITATALCSPSTTA